MAEAYAQIGASGKEKRHAWRASRSRPHHAIVHGSTRRLSYIHDMFSRRTFLKALCGAAASPPAGRMALAEPQNFASPWSEASHSAIRLIAGARAGDALMGAIEFRLAPGFKTYWRDPGDSGVPPTFDWSGSDNLAAVDVLWPTPHRFEDGGGSSIGYQAPLMLPLKVRPQDRGAPVRLALRIDYAVCEKMCIPAQGAATLSIAPSAKSGPHAKRIADAVASVPQPIAQAMGGAAKATSFGEVALTDGRKPSLSVEAWVPRDAAAIDLLIEGPKGSFFARPSIEYPTEHSRSGAFARVRFTSLIEERAKDLARWPLRMTLIVDGDGAEFETSIAAPAAR
jgi:DsbC/DsbD-like thiol-disulfide interchange protein